MLRDFLLASTLSQGEFRPMELVAPIAQSVGLPEQGALLEDVAFRLVEPDTHNRLMTALPRAADELRLAGLSRQVAQVLAEAGQPAVVTGRIKSLYSTWRKMGRKGLAVHEVTDRVALRIHVGAVSECYEVMERMGHTFEPIPGGYDDYIAHPKANGYQSLHADFVDASGRPFEIQVRTHEMHARIEAGDAAHWRYKLNAQV